MSYKVIGGLQRTVSTIVSSRLILLWYVVLGPIIVAFSDVKVG